MNEQFFTSLNGYKVKDEYAVHTYDSVALMKADSKLKEGMHVKTKGYYSANDGGHGEYIIVDDNTLVGDNGFIHELINGLKAQLIINNETINIKQLGAKGDGVTNETEIFNKAFLIAENVVIPKTEESYLVSYLIIPDNKSLIGLSNDKVTINQYRDSSQILSTLGSNCVMKNIIINSLDEDLEWNRIEINNKQNILIENCTFKGFRHDSDRPNSWGLYITGYSKNIEIKNCYFENNSQSDIAFVDGSENITINKCIGDYINFEPNITDVNKNIIIKESNFKKISLKENNFTIHTLVNITIENCIINIFDFRGGIVTLINNKISKITSPSTYGGIVNNINSYGYYKNLNEDPTFMNIQPTAENEINSWIQTYSPVGNALSRINDEKEKHLCINTNGVKTTSGIKRKFNVESNTDYSIRVLMNTITGEEIAWSGHGIRVGFYNDDTLINEIDCCIDRNNELNNESNYNEKTIFINTPENCNIVLIELLNSKHSILSYTKANYGYLFLNKINYESNNDDKDMTTYSNVVPNVNVAGFGVNNRALVDDKIYVKDLSNNFIGYICIANGNTGTYKKFGDLTSL